MSNNNEALVVNLFAGPGAGKSTTAAGVFSLLKLHGVNCELVTEYAKELTWSEDFKTLKCQPHVFGEQLRRMEMLRNKVDVIITDSPLLLSRIYCGELHYNFGEYINDAFNSFTNVNFCIIRVKPYVLAGRNQTESEAVGLDEQIEKMLTGLYHPAFRVFGDWQGINSIALHILEHRFGTGKRFSILPTEKAI